jgi:glycosyltransferase involved in cell wall biosynthesis
LDAEIMTTHQPERPVCSVIVPAYNCARTLSATLRSAVNQTVRDIEIILIDDGSSDATAALMARLADTDPRIRCLYQANQGVSAARNAGIVAAKAPIIACLDADDLWPEHHLATHLARLKTNAALGVSFSSADFIDAAGRVVGAARPQLTDLTARDFLQSNATTTCSTWVVRRAVFDRVGLFDVFLRRSEDQDWLIRAAAGGVCIEGTTAAIVSYRTATTGLASDLAGMRAGYVDLLDRVGARAIQLAKIERASALAHEDRYLARQAIRLDLPRRIARGYILSALRQQPSLLWRQPRQTWGTLIAALLPAWSRHVTDLPLAAKPDALTEHVLSVPAVSVVVPLYQTERYIGEAIGSVLAQSFTDFELIVIDDGSTDSGPAIARAFNDPRLRVITQTNRGLAGARNAGIQHARATLIAFLDADDRWHVDKLARHVRFHLDNADVGVSFSDSHLINDHGCSIGQLQTPPDRVVDAPELFCRNPLGNGSTPVIRRVTLDAIAFYDADLGRTCWFDESFRQSEDIECWLRIAATTQWRFAGIPEPLTDYRLTTSSLSADVEKQLASWQRMRAKVRTFAPDLELAHGRRAEAYQLRYLARRP